MSNSPTTTFPLLFGPPATAYTQDSPGEYNSIIDGQYHLTMPPNVTMSWGAQGEYNAFQEYSYDFYYATINVKISKTSEDKVFLFRKAFDQNYNFISDYYYVVELVNGYNTFQIESKHGIGGVFIEQLGVMITSLTDRTNNCVIETADIKLTPTLGPFSVDPIIFGNTVRIEQPDSNSNGAFTYTSSNNLVAIISGNDITAVGVGSCTITADQAAYGNYGPASTTAILTVDPATPTLGSFSVGPIIFGNTVTIQQPGSLSNGAFTYTSSNNLVAIISGNDITAVGVGSCTITADQAADGNYGPASTTATLIVVSRQITVRTIASSSSF